MATHLDAAQCMAVDCLCFRARRLARTLTRLYDEALRPLGIQATQLTLLNAIALGGESGTRMSVLCDVLALDASSLSRNLRPLEKQGLVRISRSPDDRRVRLAVLTTEGRRTVARALPLWRRAQERVTETIGGEMAVELRERLDAVVEAAGVPPVPVRTPPRDS